MMQWSASEAGTISKPTVGSAASVVVVVVAWVERSETQGSGAGRRERSRVSLRSTQATGEPPSPLVQHVLPVAHERRQQIIENPARPGLDLHGDRHAGRE